MQPHGGKESLKPSRTLLGQRVTVLEGLQQLWRKTHTPNGPFRPEQRGVSGAIERRAAAFDPLFDPTGFGVRRVAVPDAGEQRHDRTGFDTMAFGGYLRFKHALALGDVHQLVGGKDATMIPIEMVIDGVAPGRVGTSRLHTFVAHRSSGAFPRILLPAGNAEISIIAFH